MGYDIFYAICAGVASLAFIIFVIYLIRLLVAFRKTLLETNEILAKVDDQIVPLSNKALALLETTNNICGTFHNQLNSFNPLFQVVSHIGQALDESTRSFTGFQKETKTDWQNIAKEILDLTAVGINVWQQTKKRR